MGSKNIHMCNTWDELKNLVTFRITSYNVCYTKLLRVMDYFRTFAEDPRNTLVFVGYQADGTVGRRIQKGWKEILV